VGDYAACIGTTGSDTPFVLNNVNPPLLIRPTGAFEPDLGLSFAAIRDGLSNTFLVGEKHVPRGMDTLFPWDCSIFDGHNYTCNTRCAGPGFPLANSRADTRLLFGGLHMGHSLFAFADGSVRPVQNTTSEEILGLLANRDDGLPVPIDY
jgi:hypothetical protein